MNRDLVSLYVLGACGKPGNLESETGTGTGTGTGTYWKRKRKRKRNGGNGGNGGKLGNAETISALKSFLIYNHRSPKRNIRVCSENYGRNIKSLYGNY